MKKNKNILVVGGAGYIGSQMVRTLRDRGYAPVVFDNLSTGHRELVPSGVAFVRGDLRDAADLRKLFSKFNFSAVMHFAAYSLVGESVENPLKYYENNVLGCVRLLEAMLRRDVKQFIFSSTAAVYGDPPVVPIHERCATEPVNPYGRTKLMVERMLEDLSRSQGLKYVALRYFNACGAHHAAETGEWHEVETHLIPNVLKVATGEKKELVLFGDDYKTPDGTCLRDYIHVEDLAQAHLLALEWLAKGNGGGVFNLGNGKGYSVRQIIAMAEKVTGRPIRYRVGPRRPGDPARLVASARKASKVLGWKPKNGLREILETAWRWERARGAKKIP